MGVANVRGRGGEVGAVDVENLEQDEGADEPDTDDVGGEPQGGHHLDGETMLLHAQSIPPGPAKSQHVLS